MFKAEHGDEENHSPFIHFFIIQLFYAYKKLAAHMLTCSFVVLSFFCVVVATAT